MSAASWRVRARRDRPHCIGVVSFAERRALLLPQRVLAGKGAVDDDF